MPINRLTLMMQSKKMRERPNVSVSLNTNLAGIQALSADADEPADNDGAPEEEEEGAGDDGQPGAGQPAYAALAARRDAVRGWLCVLYAFAAPNR